MKKIYLLLTVLFCSFMAKQGFSQSGGTYKTARSGSWSGTGINSPWETVKPSNPCNNCTIIISNNTEVTLDISLELRGNSVLTIQRNAKLIIKDSKKKDITKGFSIILNNDNGSPMIVLAGPISPDAAGIIDASKAGNWDGVFIYGNNFITADKEANKDGYYKIVGKLGETYFKKPDDDGKDYGEKYYKPTTIKMGPLVINSNGTLPIVLANFNAALVNNTANLTWSTFSELNFSHYEIERSGDQSTWSSIGTVQGQNSPTGANYSYTDNASLHGNNYYRLKAVDIDGKYAFSDIQSVRTSTLAGLRFGPNPAVNQLGVTFGSDISSNVFLRMLSPTGQVLQEKQLRNVAGTTVMLPVQNFPPGLYILQVKTEDGSQDSFKFIVAH